MIALDLSRLLSRAGRGTPTGIDRVELAYAQHLIAARASTCFAATTVFGGLGSFPRPQAHAFFAASGAAFRGPGGEAAKDWERPRGSPHTPPPPPPARQPPPPRPPPPP